MTKIMRTTQPGQRPRRGEQPENDKVLERIVTEELALKDRDYLTDPTLLKDPYEYFRACVRKARSTSPRPGIC